MFAGDAFERSPNDSIPMREKKDGKVIIITVVVVVRVAGIMRFRDHGEASHLRAQI